MATASASLTRRSSPSIRGRGRGVWSFVGFIVVVLVLWEGVKFLGGTPWRAPGFVPTTEILWNPPFRFPFASDLNLPHVWNIALVFLEPWQRGADRNIAQFLFDAALYTWKEAFLGFALGTLLGLGARDGVRPLALAGAVVRAVRRRQPDDPDHRAEPVDRVRLRCEERGVDRRHRDLPDVLPGHDRDDPRPALVRSAGDGADALVRGLAQPDLLEAAPAGVPAVPVRRRSRSPRPRASSGRSSARAPAASTTASAWSS